MDGETVRLLVRAAVEGQGVTAPVRQDGPGVVAVRAGVGHHVQLERGQGPVPARAGLDPYGERVPRRGAVELLGPGELQLDRPPGPQRRQRHDVLDEHLLLPAERTADPPRDDPYRLGRQVQQ